MSDTQTEPRPSKGPADATNDDNRTVDAPRSHRKTWAFRFLGVAVAATVYLLLGGSDLSEDGRRVAALGGLMATWWMTEAVPLPVTSLIPIVLIPAITGIAIADVTSPYAQPIVYLFLGGFLIAVAMQRVNLHRRIALHTLKTVGTSPRRIVLGMMIATAGMSMWVNNVATTLMMLPIALSIFALVAERALSAQRDEAPESVDAALDKIRQGSNISDVVTDRNVRLFGVGLFLAVGWSASIGGLGTLFGSVPNAFIAAYLSDNFDRTIGFFEWMLLGIPLVVVFIGLSWLLITRLLFRFKLDEIPGGDAMIEQEITDLGPVRRSEKLVAAVFLTAATLWVVPSLLANVDAIDQALPWLDNIEDAAIAVGAAILLFLLPGDEEGQLMDWKDAEQRLPWGVLVLFGGGLSLAAAISTTGLDEWFGANLEGFGVLPVVLLIAGISFVILMLTEVTSNTATTAAFIPILAGVSLAIEADPMLLMVPAALAASCAFMLPVGTPPNAIVFATGAVKIHEMARGGLLLNLLGVVLVTLATLTLGPFALGIALP